ncbi:hypothetical protein [Celeribacter halophilus]|uniref:Uncharacterized protein n=1 Tax=Celeribacter halophilus TaxID=576117 RepID=A0A1I3XEE5_9RHOB|nr:hypothetical protein [Celeribacter halophilus]PZX03045.1 hypothetical protein LX82_03796 [Celeribacter halophilus]SFK17903.1 hypothetical protein SAMN04488138_1507 [Celeribacter halophilus]
MSIPPASVGRTMAVDIPATITPHLKSGSVRALALPLRPYSNLKQGDAMWAREGINVDRKQRVKNQLRLSYVGEDLFLSIPWIPSVAKPSPGFRPPSAMPVQCSRFTLIVKSVEVMRLSQISEEDALISGVFIDPDGGYTPAGFPFMVGCETANGALRVLYETQNALGVGENPEVAFVRFSAIMRNISFFSGGA